MTLHVWGTCFFSYLIQTTQPFLFLANDTAVKKYIVNRRRRTDRVLGEGVVLGYPGISLSDSSNRGEVHFSNRRTSIGIRPRPPDLVKYDNYCKCSDKTSAKRIAVHISFITRSEQRTRTAACTSTRRWCGW